MPIEEISIYNFKLITSATLELSRFNILIGPNGSGKSTVLHALAIIAGSLRRASPYTFKDTKELRCVLKREEPFKIAIKGKTSAWFPEETRSLHPEFKTVNVHYELVVTDTRLTEPWFKELRIMFPSVGLIEPLNVPLGTGKEYKIHGFAFHIYRDHMLVPMLRETRRMDWRDLLNNVNLVFVPVLRGEMKYSGKPEMGYGFRGLLYLLAKNPEMRKQLSKLLSDILGYKLETDIKITEEAVPEKLWGIVNIALNKSINYILEAFGCHQLTYLILQLLLASKGDLVMIEEPEIHLHPLSQSRLVSFLAKYVKERDIQLIITTHSEHVLFKFLNLIARGDISNKEVKIYYFMRDLEKPIAKIEELKVTEKGEVLGGLKGFFEHEVEMLEEFLKARISSR